MLGAAGFELAGPAIALGLVFGLVYGLLGVGLVLAYRTTGVINFANGEIGVFAAIVMSYGLSQWGLPYWVAFLPTIAIGAGIGALAEAGFVRRLQRAPRIMGLVITVGLAQFLLSFGFAITAGTTFNVFPDPPGFPIFHVGGVPFRPSFSAVLVFAPLVVGALTAFLALTRVGAGFRAAADDPERARTSGIRAGRLSALSWGFAGGISALVAVLLMPTVVFGVGTSLGPTLLLRSLVPAVLARMRSLPGALAGGMVFGVAEQLLVWNRPGGANVEVLLFGVILLAVLVQAPRSGRAEERGAWAFVSGWRPLAEELSRLPSVRYAWRLLAVAALGFALLVGVTADGPRAFSLTILTCMAVIGLSIGVLTGLAGQLSLGQFAFAGIGAAASYRLARGGIGLPLGLAVGGTAAALASTIVGLPALRVRGLMLAVTTLAFAVVAGGWLLQQPWLLGRGITAGPARFGSIEVASPRAYLAVVAVMLALLVLLIRNLRRSGFGRALVALRDNHDAARAFAIPVTRRKLQAFAVAGFLAGMSGAAYAHAFSIVTPTSFPFDRSVDLVAMTALGGITTLAGPLIGALYVFGLPIFVPLDSAALAASRLGWVLLILYFPGGLAQMALPVRDHLAAWLARKSTGEVAGGGSRSTPVGPEHAVGTQLGAALGGVRPTAKKEVDAGKVILEVNGLSRRFGGVVAIDGVSLSVGEGETVGIIGPNGAGKTTLFELMSGFTRPDDGQVVFDGRDVTSRRPEARAHLGLIRSFQDASLFSTMTVLEAVQLAGERLQPTGLARALVMAGEAAKRERARELVNMLHLDAWRDVPVGELSTGTRRIAELACLLALEPRLLLLDEPSAGIAQRETEALAELLVRVKTELGATLVVAEHNMPLISGIADRIVAMASGKILTEGDPNEVLDNPEVVAAYLGQPLPVLPPS